MKTMKKILILFVAMIAFTACDENENTTFDSQGGQTLAVFNSSSSNLEVVIEETGSVDIEIGVTTVSSAARTVTVMVDEEASSAATENYSFNSTVTIPAGEYTGTLTVDGVDVSVETAAETIVFKLASVDGGIVSSSTHEVSIFQVCPVPDGVFSGMYLIEQTSALVDGPTLSTGTVVELKIVDALTREFDTQNYPDYCASFQAFQFKLVCNELFVPTQNSVCACASGGTGWFSAATMAGGYDVNDDTEFFLTFTDDTESSCSAPVQTTYKFTKQ